MSTLNALQDSFSTATKNVARRLLNAAGYDIPHRLIALEKIAGDIPHARVFPYATYSPWLQDPEFEAAFKLIVDHTLVDRYRLYELWQLAEQASKLDGDFLEVGVWRGGTAALMGARLAKFRPGATLHACDTFQGVPKASEKDTRYQGGEHAGTSAQMVQGLMTRCGLKNISILEGMFPEDTASSISDRRFSLVHIDVDTYNSGRDITEWVWNRMVPGALIIHDDYGTLGCEGITRLVNEERNKPDRLVIHNLNGHAIIVKLP
jgi:O-methyltransferase